MFLELKEEDNEFRKSHFNILIYRLAFASLELEGIDGDLASVNQTDKIYNQLEAINNMFKEGDDYVNSHYEFLKLLCDTASLVTGKEVSGFRKTLAIVNGSKIERTEPSLIRNDLLYLIDDYKYALDNKTIDPFEAEAMFHIRLLHIHPFEDGNGRCARIFLTYNLCKNDLAPCIITKEDKKEYCDLIERGDQKNLAEFFRKRSNMELENMILLYTKLDKEGKISSNKMPEALEEEYRRMKK